MNPMGYKGLPPVPVAHRRFLWGDAVGHVVGSYCWTMPLGCVAQEPLGILLTVVLFILRVVS